MRPALGACGAGLHARLRARRTWPLIPTPVKGPSPSARPGARRPLALLQRCRRHRAPFPKKAAMRRAFRRLRCAPFRPRHTTAARSSSTPCRLSPCVRRLDAGLAAREWPSRGLIAQVAAGDDRLHRGT
eukprot:366488-Chlamydomonas_euryale.AAC.5